MPDVMLVECVLLTAANYLSVLMAHSHHNLRIVFCFSEDIFKGPVGTEEQPIISVLFTAGVLDSEAY